MAGRAVRRALASGDSPADGIVALPRGLGRAHDARGLADLGDSERRVKQRQVGARLLAA